MFGLFEDKHRPDKIACAARALVTAHKYAHEHKHRFDMVQEALDAERDEAEIRDLTSRMTDEESMLTQTCIVSLQLLRELGAGPDEIVASVDGQAHREIVQAVVETWRQRGQL